MLSILLISLIAAPFFINFSVHRNVPIEFYGKVVDENGAGVAGVKVGGHVVREKLFVEPGLWTWSHSHDDFEIQTGADGRFEVKGYRGFMLRVSDFEKEGFELSADNEGAAFQFEYAPDPTDPGIRPFVPDDDQPIIYKVRRYVPG